MPRRNAVPTAPSPPRRPFEIAMPRILFAIVLALLLAPLAGRAAPGVSADEIVVGSILDLSGPAALLGVPVRDGMRMRFDEANARGGVHGRKIRLVVEDSGYDPRRGVLAMQKLLQRDEAFAFLADLGTPVVLATQEQILRAGRIQLAPFSPHERTYLPLEPLKFQIFAPYQDYMRAAVEEMLRRHPYRRVGILYQDDDYGQEVMKGVEAGLAKHGQQLVERQSYKRGATDFSSQIARLRAADCDLVVLATVVRETIGAMQEARRTGWNVDMLVSASGYSAQTHELGGPAMEGLYGVSVLPHPYVENANRDLADWIRRYRAEFGALPNVWSAMGYTIADLFVRAAEAAGPELSAPGFAQALEKLPPKRDFFGGPEYRFSATDHLGNRYGRLARIEHGRWELISDYLH